MALKMGSGVQCPYETCTKLTEFGGLSKSLPETGQSLWRMSIFQVRQMTLALIWGQNFPLMSCFEKIF